MHPDWGCGWKCDSMQRSAPALTGNACCKNPYDAAVDAPEAASLTAEGACTGPSTSAPDETLAEREDVLSASGGAEAWAPAGSVA